MSNPSYIRFENTSVDLRDCIHALQNALDENSDLSSLSESERDAAITLADLCQRYVEFFENVDLS